MGQMLQFAMYQRIDPDQAKVVAEQWVKRVLRLKQLIWEMSLAALNESWKKQPFPCP
jgi:hypothetical protein